MNGFKIEIDKAGYPMAGSLDDIGLKTFVQEFLNKPQFINRMFADVTFLDYLTIEKNLNRLFKNKNLNAIERIILTHIDATVLAHPFLTQLLHVQEPIRPIEKRLRRGIQVGGVVPYIAGVLVASAVLYLFRRPTVATYKPLSKDERRWVITYNFNTTVQFVVKFTVDPRFIQKYRWEYDIYTKLRAKNNEGTFNVANFYDWQEKAYYHDKPFEFVFTYKKKVYHHIEKPENLMDESFQATLLTHGWLNTGALIGIYNPDHRPLSRLGLDLDIPRYTSVLYNVLTNLNAAFTIGGLLHGDFKSDNILIDVKTKAAFIFDLDFAQLIMYPPAQRKDTINIERDIHGVFHPTSVNYLFTKKPVPKKISILFLHFFDIFFLAYSIHYGHHPDNTNALNRFFQTYYGRNPDFDIFLACFNALSQFRNTYKDPKGYFDYLDYDTLLSINKAVIFSTHKNVFTVYPHDSSTRTVIQDILSVQAWNF